MNQMEIVSQLKSAYKQINERTNIENVNQFYALKVISVASELATAYESNQKDATHPKVKSLMSNLKSTSYKFLASSLKPREGQSFEELMNEISQQMIENNFFDETELNNLANERVADTIEQFIAFYFYNLINAQNAEDEAMIVFGLFRMHLVVSQQLYVKKIK